MGHTGKGYDINQTFIIEAQSSSGDTPVVSACTAIYSNALFSCSGNTNIILGNGIISFNGNLYTNNDISGTTIYASTYYSGGTNLFNIIEANNITGGTFNNTTDTLTLNKKNNQIISVTGFSDYYTTGTTLIGNTLYFNRNDVMSAYTANLASLSGDNTYVTGVTFTDNQLIIVRNDGVKLNTFINSFTGLTVNGNISGTTFYGDGSNLTGISTQDTFVTGGTYSNGTAIFTNNTGGTFNVSGFSTAINFSGGSVTGLTATTISATTYLGLPLDIRVTGGTYSSGTAIFTNNTGGTFNVSGFSSSSTISGDYLPLSGGTVSGNTIFNSGLTVNYIDFDITPTIPNPTGGTLFFDSNENALSYKPITNQNDVTVNLGQESLIRVYNALPTTILNGQVLHITGATSGVPTVALANASKLGLTFTDSLAQSSGVATHDIPSGQYGFMTNFGVVRDLNTTAFTVGQEVFLSDTIDGALTNDPNNIAFTSRISTVGYCLESNATTGKILVVITNENPLQSLTQQEINVLLGNTISTGAYFYTGATTASTTTINVSPMRGWIVYNTGPTYATNPLVLNIYYSGGTNIAVTGLTSSFDTYLLVNSGGTLYQTNSFPSPIERRENIFLGRVVHPNKTTILNVEQSVDYDISPLSSLRDLWVPIKIINEGVVPSPNGATLTFKTSSGTFWGNGIGFTTNELNPNAITVPAYLPASFYYTTQTGGTFTATTTTVDTLNYDVGGVKTNVPGSGSYTTQRIYMSQSGVIRLQYGQNYHSTLAKAIAAIPSETFVVNPDNSIDCTLIGLLTVKDGTGNLSNTDDAVFTFVSKFGEILGGTAGISTTTLQQAYDNSVTPEIVINAVLDGLSIQNGTGNADNVTRLLEGLNAGGSVTSFIRGDGYISGTTFQSNGFSANTGGLTASTINIRTIGSGPSITNLGIDSFGNVVSGVTGNGGSSTFTGGTVTGPTIFTSGLSANTMSATTYYNLPIDVYSTGGTYNGSNLYITNNTGGTFTITGLTATGFSANYYGSFSDTDIQVVSGANIASVWKYNTTELSNGISVVNNSQIKVANKGIYEIGYSAQIEKTQGTEANVTIWASINGTPVSRSSSITSLVANSALQLPFVSYIFELNANDYVEFYFSSPSQYVQISTFSGLTSPTRPIAPSVIVIAKQVGLSVTDNFGGHYLPLSGGTVSGATIFTSGLSANTMSATTYYNLPYWTAGTNTYSVAQLGGGNIASGAYSLAVGSGTTASGDNSHSEGYLTTAIGLYSHAEGGSTTALGNNSHAEGNTTIANAPNAHAEGSATFAVGDGSHAEGQNTIANGQASHAEGYYTLSNGFSTHSEGGFTTASGNYSHAEGNNTRAIGDFSHSEGSGTTASGVASHAGGFNTSAYTPYSFAIGVNSIASGSSVVSSASPITIVSAITITLSDPTYSLPAVVLSDKVADEWMGYYNDFCSPFTIYSGSSSQIIDCHTYTDIYFDSGLTYIVDSSIVSTDYDMISGNTFQYLDVSVLQPAFAIGNEVKAYGGNSFAEGSGTTASGDASHAEGQGTTASNTASHAEGSSTRAVGDASHAEGLLTTAVADASHAEGYHTIASSTASHAEGAYTTASGDYSHSEGQNTTASGNFSHAEGVSTKASNTASHAEGYYTTASGSASHAEGYGTIASGSTSHAEGRNTIASGDYSHSEGYQTTASGAVSHAEGYETTAGETSHAEGYQTIASGGYSHAEGYGSMATGYTSHAEGNYARAFGTFSHAEGQLTIASGHTSHAEGFTTIASGETSHAEGFRTTASGDYSHAEGYETIASGNTSHAEGANTTASGNYSHAEGNNTRAIGDFSHSEGRSTTASGDYSHAEGVFTTASGTTSHAEGSGTTSFGSVSHAEGDRTKALGNYSHAEGQLSIASGTTSHAEGYGTTALGNYSHAGGYQSSASGTHSFVHGNNSVAQNSSTIVLGSNITGTSINTTYVDSLNIKTINSGTLVNNLGYDSNGNVIIGTTSSSSPITGTTSIDFGAAVSGETSYTMVTVNSALVTESSNIVLRISGSTNHPDIEDSMIDGVVISTSDIVDNVSFNINAFSSEGTWGVYNIKYLIIN